MSRFFKSISCNIHTTSLPPNYDVTIIGAGIIGASIARYITLRDPNLKVVIVEKEEQAASHQSSHNSGVIHSGFYYEPSSLKAKLCVEGSSMVIDYCKDKNIKYVQCGKLLLANTRCEIQNLEELYKRGIENSVPGLELLKDKSSINKIQPDSKGVQALWSPLTANVDWGEVTNHFLDDFLYNGGSVFYNFNVNIIKRVDINSYSIEIGSPTKKILSKYLICCPGLQSETIDTLIGESSNDKHVSFRVQYMLLDDCGTNKIKTNVYEVPDPETPFLGVHFSPRPDGKVLLGPSAVPALRIEGYRMDDLNLNYIKNVISFKGFQKMTLKNFNKCVNQIAKTIFPEFQHKELQKLVGTLTLKEIVPGPIAVQTQMIQSNGKFVDDFVFKFFEGDDLNSKIINCKFLPSPAASSSMAIGKYVSKVFIDKYRKDCSG